MGMEVKRFWRRGRLQSYKEKKRQERCHFYLFEPFEVIRIQTDESRYLKLMLRFDAFS